jgi:hypothetical protein
MAPERSFSCVSTCHPCSPAVLHKRLLLGVIGGYTGTIFGGGGALAFGPRLKVVDS